MELIADENARVVEGCEVTLQTKARTAYFQHFVVNAAVNVMAECAAFTHRLVFKDKGARLLLVASKAGLAFLRWTTSSCHVGITFMWIMAIHAAHAPFENRMVMR